MMPLPERQKNVQATTSGELAAKTMLGHFMADLRFAPANRSGGRSAAIDAGASTQAPHQRNVAGILWGVAASRTCGCVYLQGRPAVGNGNLLVI
jgi:hypothetical protein